MEITYFGQSAFRLRGKDVSVVTDPLGAASRISMPKVSAHIVTLSWTKGRDISAISDAPRVIAGPGEYEVADVLIAGVATSEKPMTGSTNTAYVVRFDDLAVCHLGNLASRLSDKQVEELGGIDVLMVPVGGGKALSPVQAAEVVAQLEPLVVIPMQYKMDDADDDLDPVDMFCREMGVKEFVTEPKLVVTRGSLGQMLKVNVLEHKATVAAAAGR